MKSFREFAILLLSSFCCIMVHAQKEYNGVITGTSPRGTLEEFIETTESAPVTVTELIAGIKFGMSRMQYNAHYDQLEKLECDHFKIIINGISYYASDGEQSFYEDELYNLNLYLRYKDLDGKELTKADFDSLAIYFKSVYGDDSLHYTYTENPVSQFPTHHWRKNNLYFQLSWLPEDEISNTISLEYRNGPVYRKVMSGTSPRGTSYK